MDEGTNEMEMDWRSKEKSSVVVMRGRGRQITQVKKGDERRHMGRRRVNRPFLCVGV